MPDLPETTMSRRRDGMRRATAAGRPDPCGAGPGNGRRRTRGSGTVNKRAPERSAAKSLPASRSGARWQGGRKRLPPWEDALQEKRDGKWDGERGASFGGLRGWPEHIRADHVPRNASDALEIPNTFSGNTPPRM